MRNVSVSVIVAIYNAEKTIKRLTDSLKVQTMPNFEVLLIDDGSTDASAKMCDEFAQSDDRFKVFHKQNEGIGATRQFGIEHALGEYTIHADSDDWVEPDYLNFLYNEAVSSGADMVVCDILYEHANRTVYQNQKPKAFDKDTLLRELLCRMANGPCDKLIKRSFYMQNKIEYPKGLDVGEDQIFNLLLVLAGAKVSYVPKALYHYDLTANPNSASRGISIKKIQQGERFVSELHRILPDYLETIIDDKNLDVAYMAIKSKVYGRLQVKEKYSFLARVRWKDYHKKPLSVKLIIWTALHTSYSLAVFMYDIKRIKSRL